MALNLLAGALALMLAASPPAAGQSAGPAAGSVGAGQIRQVTAGVSAARLSNGMELVVIEDHRAPAVVHMVWYRAGAADEPPGKSGSAHYLEHLLFKGTDKLAPGEFSRIVAAQGGSDNAFTGHDYTAYWQRVAADRLELMMSMEADRMVNIRLDDRDIATELQVILEERNQRTESDPAALFREDMAAAQYLNHPYGRPIIGWRHEVEALGLAEVMAFYRRHYAPNNAVLVVAGDVTPADVLRLAERHYGAIAPNPQAGAPRQRPQEPPQRAARRVIFRDARVAQPYILRTWLAPERDSAAQREAAALVLLGELLGGGQSSWLSRRLQFEQKIAVWTSASHRATALDDSTFAVFVLPVRGIALAEAEKALDTALARFFAEGPDPADLARVKRRLQAAEIYERDSVQSLANRYGQALTSGLRPEDVAAWPAILQSITAREIVEVGRRYLVPERSVTGWLTPPQAPAGAEAAPAARSAIAAGAGETGSAGSAAADSQEDNQ